jgi:NitT/TauT family transport system substrate-binding protein
MYRSYRGKAALGLVFVAALILCFSGCSREAEAKPQKLTVGMMPAADAAPFYYALDAGLFEKAGIEVELILFTSAQNRQTALQTGQIDGAMTDLVALVTTAASDTVLKGTMSTDGIFPLLSAVDLDQTRTLRAGVMEISVTNYILDAYLADSHTLEKVYIHEIPTRLEALASGSLDVAVFPEPFASIGELRGLSKQVFPGTLRMSMNIIAFTGEALTGKRSELLGFHAALQEALAALSAEPERAVDILMKHIPNLPEAVREKITLPEYHPLSLPDEQSLREIISWTAGITGREYRLEPDDIIDGSFLPEL